MSPLEIDHYALLVVTIGRFPRGLQALRAHGAVEKTPEGYRLTLLGTLAEQGVDRFTRHLDAITEARPLLGYLDEDAEIDMRLLAGADVHVSEPVAPLKPVARLEELVLDADDRTVRGTTPNILPQYVEFFHAQVVEEGLSAEFVLGADVMDYLVSNHRDVILAVIESGRATVARLPGSGLEYGLAIAGGESVWVGVHDDGLLRGAIVNSESAAIEWAEERFESLRERADVVEATDLEYRGGNTRLGCSQPLQGE